MTLKASLSTDCTGFLKNIGVDCPLPPNTCGPRFPNAGIRPQERRGRVLNHVFNPFPEVVLKPQDQCHAQIHQTVLRSPKPSKTRVCHTPGELVCFSHRAGSPPPRSGCLHPRSMRRSTAPGPAQRANVFELCLSACFAPKIISGHWIGHKLLSTSLVCVSGKCFQSGLD